MGICRRRSASLAAHLDAVTVNGAIGVGHAVASLAAPTILPALDGSMRSRSTNKRLSFAGRQHNAAGNYARRNRAPSNDLHLTPPCLYSAKVELTVIRHTLIGLRKHPLRNLSHSDPRLLHRPPPASSKWTVSFFGT
jgi:hypothetical protein